MAGFSDMFQGRDFTVAYKKDTSSLGSVAASCVIGTTFTTPSHTLLHLLEKHMIALSWKQVETNPVFVADGYEVCRVVLLRELCKCRQQTE